MCWVCVSVDDIPVCQFVHTEHTDGVDNIYHTPSFEARANTSEPIIDLTLDDDDIEEGNGEGDSGEVDGSGGGGGR